MGQWMGMGNYVSRMGSAEWMFGFCFMKNSADPIRLIYFFAGGVASPLARHDAASRFNAATGAAPS